MYEIISLYILVQLIELYSTIYWINNKDNFTHTLFSFYINGSVNAYEILLWHGVLAPVCTCTCVLIEMWISSNLEPLKI